MAPAAEDYRLSRNKLVIILAVTAMTLAAYGSVAGVMPWGLAPGLVLPINLAALAFVLGQRRFLGRAAPAFAIWLVMSSAVMIGYGAVHGSQVLFWRQAFMLGACLALACFLASRTALHWGARARVAHSVLATAAAMTVGGGLGLNVLHMATAHLPMVCDAILHRMDSMLGLNDVLRMLADVLWENHPLFSVALAVYEYNLLFTLPAMLSEMFFTRKAVAELGSQLFASALLAFPFYCIAPGIGPSCFFGAGFPDHMPALQPLSAHFAMAPMATPRNAMPSVHFTWALLFWLALRNSPVWQRMLAAGFLGLTVLATLGFGEHYAVDLIAACSFTLFIRGLCCGTLPLRARPRASAIVYGMVTMGLWMAVIRCAPASLSLPWIVPSLAVVSILGLAAVEMRLYRAERGDMAATVLAPA